MLPRLPRKAFWVFCVSGLLFGSRASALIADNLPLDINSRSHPREHVGPRHVQRAHPRVLLVGLQRSQQSPPAVRPNARQWRDRRHVCQYRQPQLRCRAPPRATGDRGLDSVDVPVHLATEHKAVGDLSSASQDPQAAHHLNPHLADLQWVRGPVEFAQGYIAKRPS